MANTRSIETSILTDCLESVSVDDNGRIAGKFIFAPDFPAFEGHFPGEPILPAVVQLTSVRLLAAKHLGKRLAPVSVERAKFKNMIGPEEEVNISIALDQSAHDVRIAFTITTARGKAATGEICCRFGTD